MDLGWRVCPVVHEHDLCMTLICIKFKSLCINAGPQRGLRGPRANTKSGALHMDCVKGVWGMPPGNFEILHALKCVLGAPEALFHAYTQYL